MINRFQKLIFSDEKTHIGVLDNKTRNIIGLLTRCKEKRKFYSHRVK
jgi:hypothetical protein